MAADSSFIAVTAMSYEETVRFSEEQVQRPNSRLFNELLGDFAGIMGTLKESQERRLKEKKSRRLVIPHALESAEVFDVGKAYPQYTLSFKHSVRMGAAVSRAVNYLSSERLIDRVKGTQMGAIGYGFGVNQLIVHERANMHVCIARESVPVAVDMVREDRVLCAVQHAAIVRGKDLQLASEYRTGERDDMVCGNPADCTVRARAGVMNLMDSDTNYLQVCCWMRQHGVQLNYISFVTSKCIELNYDGDIPELGAHVINDGDNYHLIYKDAVCRGRTYRRTNHLSLIAKTYERVGEYTFVKEFCDRVMGVSTYKITMMKTDLPVPDIEYRSWSDLSVKESYLVNSYELKEMYMNPNDTNSYVLRSFQHPREPINKLVAYARRLDTVQFTPQVLMERLRTDITTSVHGGYSMKNRIRRVSDKDFVAVALAVYARVFSERYYRPKGDKHVENQIQLAEDMGSAGVFKLALAHVSVLYYTGVVVHIELLAGKLRDLMKSWFIGKVTPLPYFTDNQPYIRYCDSLKPKEWLRKRDWRDLLGNPWSQFDPLLPGLSEAMADGRSPLKLCYDVGIVDELAEAMEDDIGYTREDVNKSVEDEAVSSALVCSVEQVRKPVADCLDVKKIVASVTDQAGQLVDTRPMALTEMAVVLSRPKFQDAAVPSVKKPIALLCDALSDIFPGSTLLETSMVGADIHYGGFDIVAKAVKLKLTTAKLKTLRPEMLYQPMLRTQILPNAKQTMPAMLPTIVKRNLNTTSSVEPMCVDRMWSVNWENMKKAYYNADVEEHLASWDVIGPTAELVGEWASKLDPVARKQLANEQFDMANIDVAIQESKLMLKSKRKPNLGATFSTAVKAAQSIQYDSTKRRTALFSPMFAEKVRRDRMVLRNDVIIMQSKSIADLNTRLACFDWRPNKKGALRYCMLDGEMFDKSQVMSTLEMHWRKCEKFGMSSQMVELLRQHAAYRKASSQEAGIQVFLTPQRGSGDSDTLDGNCDVSQSAYARFIADNRDIIEFVLIMGDDVTIAFRGELDIMGLERECMTEFNLSVKATVSEFGNFVSGWLVHMPDGGIVWVTDPVKRAVALGDRSVVSTTDFDEKYLAFKDLCSSLNGEAIRNYLVPALAASYSRDLGYPISCASMNDVYVGVISVASSYDEFRQLYSVVPKKYSY
jgi:hypothetical protein